MTAGAPPAPCLVVPAYEPPAVMHGHSRLDATGSRLILSVRVMRLLKRTNACCYNIDLHAHRGSLLADSAHERKRRPRCSTRCSPPIANSLFASFIVAALPIILVLVLLGWARRPAWQASLADLVLAFIIAVTG